MATNELDLPEGLTAKQAERWRLAAHWKVPVAAVLGRTHLALSEIVAVRKGSVLALNSSTALPLDLEVGGRVLFRGLVYRSGERYALRISETVE